MKTDRVSLQHRPFLTPIWLTVLAAVASVIVVVFGVWVWGTADATTVIVIRHAEKEAGGAEDPPLTAQGQARAALLAQMFGDASAPGHIDAIYVSPTVRNRATAAPLAARLGLTEIVAPADDPRGLARRALREHSGARVLIVGHSDTVRDLVEALSEEKNIPEVAAQEYGTMYIVTVPRIGHANVLRLKY
jgi:2,3-bisphosphoglycerate-dependent phosphoglycerate mutase